MVYSPLLFTASFELLEGGFDDLSNMRPGVVMEQDDLALSIRSFQSKSLIHAAQLQDCGSPCWPWRSFRVFSSAPRLPSPTKRRSCPFSGGDPAWLADLAYLLKPPTPFSASYSRIYAPFLITRDDSIQNSNYCTMYSTDLCQLVQKLNLSGQSTGNISRNLNMPYTTISYMVRNDYARRKLKSGSKKTKFSWFNKNKARNFNIKVKKSTCYCSKTQIWVATKCIWTSHLKEI